MYKYIIMRLNTYGEYLIFLRKNILRIVYKMSHGYVRFILTDVLFQILCPSLFIPLSN